ncbi:MAG: hypothetical protein Q8T03_09905 [Bacteroidota bacterium]|nr:hypothetical protein [Bacteroidota bacterium]
MERRNEVKVKNGKEYDHLFPRAMLTTIVKKEGATVADTIKFIPQVVNETLFHTKKIAKVLEGDNLRETCRNIWQFVYDHIAYKKDEDGKEQVRSPARAWHDRNNIQGVDCDCYTVFISSILTNLKIRHILRITKYKEDHFQHIYPIVPLPDGNYITIDCVVRNFDYEEPYSEKKDTKMDLEYLNGVFDSNNKSTDALDLVGIYDDREAMSELGKLFKRKSGGGGSSGGKKKMKFKDVLKKGLHLTNILNPATATIRAGVLLSAKLNVMKIGERLKWAYLSDDDAKKKGIDMGRFAKLKKIKDKLEKIFYGMGGKPENLKKAILTGKGNKNHEVSGLGYAYDPMEGLDGMGEYTSASTILGTEMYRDELSGVNDDNGELGIVTATAIASATGVIGAIAALLKGIGSIFPKKGKDAEGGGGDGTGTDSGGGGDGDSNSSSESGGGTSSSDSSNENSGANSDGGENNKVALKKSKSESSSTTNDESGGSDNSEGDSSNAKSKDSGTNGKDDANPDGFWAKNKKWIKPVAIGLTGVGLLYLGYKVVTHKKPPEAKPALSGIAKSKKKKKGGKKAMIKSNKHKKESVALL